jgi:hypothetical protein
MIKVIRQALIFLIFTALTGIRPGYASSQHVEGDKLFDNFNTNQNNDQHIKVDKFIFQNMKNGKATGTPLNRSNSPISN